MSIYTGFTRLCKGLAVVLIGGHIVVQILPSAVSYLALVPAKTSVDKEMTLIISFFHIPLRFIRKLWHILIAGFTTGPFLLVGISLQLDMLSSQYMGYMPISGFQGVLFGFLVGIKQIIPDQELSLLKDDSTRFTLGSAPLPGSNPIEASRRRERGNRALEERLAEILAASDAAAGRTEEDRQKHATGNV